MELAASFERQDSSSNLILDITWPDWPVNTQDEEESILVHFQ